jgi:hypothetical protein
MFFSRRNDEEKFLKGMSYINCSELNRCRDIFSEGDILNYFQSYAGQIFRYGRGIESPIRLESKRLGYQKEGVIERNSSAKNGLPKVLE